MATPTSPHVLLRQNGQSVGFGKILISNGAASTTIHGHELREHARHGEELVSVYGVQIYNEYASLCYPYNFSTFDDPPILLQDLNDRLKYFKSPVAWDKSQLLPNPRKDELVDEPRQVAAPKGQILAPQSRPALPPYSYESGEESGASQKEQGPGHLAYGVLQDATEMEGEIVQEFSELSEAPTANEANRTQLEENNVASCAKMDAIALLSEASEINKKRKYTYRVRKKGVAEKSRLSLRRIQEAKESTGPFRSGLTCCNADCLNSVNETFALGQRRMLLTMSRVERKQWMNDRYDSENNCFKFSGIVACYRFFRVGFGISVDLLTSVKNTECAPASADPRQCRRFVRNRSACIVEAFLSVLARRLGDFLPNEKKDVVTIPLYTKKAVYLKFVDYFDAKLKQNWNCKPPSMSYFMSIWKKRCPQVRARKRSGFQKCAVCTLYRDRVREHLDNGLVLDELRGMFSDHIRMVMAERDAYAMRQILAEDDPHRFLSIIVDGADQKNYGIPHFVEASKSDRGHQLKVKIIAAMQHMKRGERHLHLFAMTDEFATGANHIIEVIHRFFQGKKKTHGKLPPILFIQLDNCTRENKNRFLFAYLELLVAMGVFKEIQASFLPIGHTHADIDQSFSAISSHLRQNDAVTMDDLLFELRQCYKKRVTTSELLRVANFSSLCERSRCLRSMTGAKFSRFRFFKFTSDLEFERNDYYRVCCFVKIQQSAEWEPFTGNAKGFLTRLPNLARTPPTTTTVAPNLTEVTKCFEAVEERIRDARKMESLRNLRDRIYTRRVDPFHWDLSDSFETMGAYIRNSETQAVATEQESLDEELDAVLRDDADYLPGEFLAVKPVDTQVPFWIAKLRSVDGVDMYGRAKTLIIRWYQAGEGESDAFLAKYTPALRQGQNGRSTIFEDSINVATVLLKFEKLTTGGKLHSNTGKRLREVLIQN